MCVWGGGGGGGVLGGYPGSRSILAFQRYESDISLYLDKYPGCESHGILYFDLG